MRCTDLVILAGLTIPVALGCTREDVGELEIVEDEPSGSSSTEGEHATERAGSEPDPVEPLLDGSHSVFGLRVPRGMKPAAGPNQVYRFEGTLELAHVKRYVMRQVETGHLLEEPTGYLIRKARVLAPVGSSPADVLLAVRIFRGRRGGASVDAWVETESLAKLRGGQSGLPGYRTGGANKGDERPPPRLDATQRAKRLEQRKQAFDDLETAARGKGQPRDRESPLNY